MQSELFTPSSVTRPPLRYHGGKFRLAPWVISHFPPHEIYVEIETSSSFNGICSGLIAAFKFVARKGSQRDQVDQAISRTFVPEHSEEIYNLSFQVVVNFDFRASFSQQNTGAAAEVVRCFLGHGTCSMDPDDSNGFRSCDIRAGKSYAREWAGVPSALVAAAERLTGVTIENLDYRRLVPKFDCPNTFFYADPPYVMGTRKAGGKGYVHEMSNDDHRQLAWILNQTKARCAVSGYPCDLYESLFAGWRRVEKQTTANGQRGSLPRTEVLWMNYETAI